MRDCSRNSRKAHGLDRKFQFPSTKNFKQGTRPEGSGVTVLRAVIGHSVQNATPQLDYAQMGCGGGQLFKTDV